MSNKMSEKKFMKNPNKTDAGFSLVEVVIAIFVLTIGLIGTAAAISYALEYSSISRNVTSAKSVIIAAIEEIETLRNARRLEFKQIANDGKVDNTGAEINFAGFSKDFVTISLNPGPDGVNGTPDDLRNPGNDGKFGTADDFDDTSLIRGGFLRKITITDLDPTIKKIEIKVRYVGSGGKTGEITGVCYLNDELRVTE